MSDDVTTILRQWAAERPDLDVSPMAVIGRLARAHRLASARLDTTFASHGLDAASFDVLATLRRSGSPFRLTPRDLQRTAMITSSAVAQRLNRLEANGLVSRTPSADDGRATDVTLTPAGRALVDRALPDHVATEHALLDGLTDTQRTALALLLEQLCASIEHAPASSGARSTE